MFPVSHTGRLPHPGDLTGSLAAAGIYTTVVSAWGHIGHCLGQPCPPCCAASWGLLQVTSGLRSVSRIAQRWDLSHPPLGPCSFSPDTTTLLRASSSQPREGPQRLVCKGFPAQPPCSLQSQGGRPALHSCLR